MELCSAICHSLYLVSKALHVRRSAHEAVSHLFCNMEEASDYIHRACQCPIILMILSVFEGTAQSTKWARYKGIICQKKLLWQFYSIYRTAPNSFPSPKPTKTHQPKHPTRNRNRLSKSHALLDLGNGESRVQALGASPAAVQNGVATVQAHAVVESVHALGGLLVTGVGDPAV